MWRLRQNSGKYIGMCWHANPSLGISILKYVIIFQVSLQLSLMIDVLTYTSMYGIMVHRAYITCSREMQL